jgi:hypothetical protein
MSRSRSILFPHKGYHAKSMQKKEQRTTPPTQTTMHGKVGAGRERKNQNRKTKNHCRGNKVRNNFRHFDVVRASSASGSSGAR